MKACAKKEGSKNKIERDKFQFKKDTIITKQLLNVSSCKTRAKTVLTVF